MKIPTDDQISTLVFICGLSSSPECFLWYKQLTDEYDITFSEYSDSKYDIMITSVPTNIKFDKMKSEIIKYIRDEKLSNLLNE